MNKFKEFCTKDTWLYKDIIIDNNFQFFCLNFNTKDFA